MCLGAWLVVDPGWDATAVPIEAARAPPRSAVVMIILRAGMRTFMYPFRDGWWDVANG